MVMDEVREDGVGEEALEESNVLGESNQPEKFDVVQEIVGVIESVAQFGDYRRTQKKECHGIVRRMKMLLPLFEEIRDLERPIAETGIAWLCNLKKALLFAKRLLKTCNEGSKIYLVIRILKLCESFP